MGTALAGKQTTIREFFLAGRTLPWWAVSGSIVATEISAVTLISVPALVYGAGGDLRYLQLAIGAVLARVIIGIWFVPAFYEREIYSPYDYMANRLGSRVRTLTTCLFILGTLLGQSARLLLPAIILEEIAGIPMSVSIWIIGIISIVWTLLGGITTVIWTDVIQFFVFLVAIVAALTYVIISIDGGWSQVVTTARAAGKLRTWDLRIDPALDLTLWAGLIGNTLLCLNAYGTDQMIAQRMFCCRSPREASLAIISSSVGLIVMILALAVGLGLYTFYQEHPLTGELAGRVLKDKDRIFPIFIIHEMPIGLKGVIIAGLFAAASTTSALAALAQTIITAFYQPWRIRTTKPGDEVSAGKHDVVIARLLIVLFGVALCVMAQYVDLARARYGDILRLALAMATYTGGTLLAAFLLALLRLDVNDRGILWAAPISILAVFTITWRQPWAQTVSAVGGASILFAWLLFQLWPVRSRTGQDQPPVPLAVQLAQTMLVATVTGAILALPSIERLVGSGPLNIAWPWNVPVGFVVAFTLGYFLAGRNQLQSPLRGFPVSVVT